MRVDKAFFFFYECVSKHQSTNSFQTQLYIESKNIFTTNRLIAIFNWKINGIRMASFEFTKG